MDKQKQLVINFFGGPGVGKSTNALLTAGRLKRQGIETEYAEEWIKGHLYAGGKWGFSDQRYTFAKQRKQILERLSNPKVTVVVTDSPFLLSAVYGATSQAFKDDVVDQFLQLNNLNIVLTRDIPYSPVGRRGDARSAAGVDLQILDVLKRYGISYVEARGSDADIIAWNLAVNRLREMGVL